jgi:hypothetical protein
MVGLSLTLVTVIGNDWVTPAFPSSALITIEWSPTSEFPGVPVNIPVSVSNVNQLGIVVPVNVTVSPVSISSVSTV